MSDFNVNDQVARELAQCPSQIQQPAGFAELNFFCSSKESVQEGSTHLTEFQNKFLDRLKSEKIYPVYASMRGHESSCTSGRKQNVIFLEELVSLINSVVEESIDDRSTDVLKSEISEYTCSFAGQNSMRNPNRSSDVSSETKQPLYVAKSLNFKMVFGLAGSKFLAEFLSFQKLLESRGTVCRMASNNSEQVFQRHTDRIRKGMRLSELEKKEKICRVCSKPLSVHKDKRWCKGPKRPLASPQNAQDSKARKTGNGSQPTVGGSGSGPSGSNSWATMSGH